MAVRSWDRAGVLGRVPALPRGAWAAAALGALAVAATAGFLLYPTHPTYDSLYSLVWARELLDGQTPTFTAYRAPTQHPLAIGFGTVLVGLFGDAADRLVTAFSIASFLALVAGLYRLARQSFTRLVGVLAALILLSRLDFPYLAIRGYVDIPYLALVVWAAVLEANRPRRGGVVWLLLAAAGLLRPEGWVLAGLYFLWMAWRATWAERARYAALAAIAPAIWAGVDAAVTGDPLFSLHSTSGLAEELGRRRDASDIPKALPAFLVSLLKLPVAAGGVLGLGLAAWLAPRRMVMPTVLLLSGIATFLFVGIAGFSVIERYLVISALALMVFAAFSIAGFQVLPRGSSARRLWAGAGLLLVLYAAAFAVTHLNVDYIRDDLSARSSSRNTLEQALTHPAVAAGRRCGPVSVPNHKLIPEVRWVLHADARAIVARTDPSASRLVRRGVALYVVGRGKYFDAQRLGLRDRYEPLAVTPPPGFRPAARTRDYAAYVHC